MLIKEMIIDGLKKLKIKFFNSFIAINVFAL